MIHILALIPTGSYNNNSGPDVAAIVLGVFMVAFVTLLIAAGVIIIRLTVIQKRSKLAKQYNVINKSTGITFVVAIAFQI